MKNLILLILVLFASGCQTETDKLTYIQKNYKTISIFTIPETQYKYVITKECGEVMYVDFGNSEPQTVQLVPCRDIPVSVEAKTETRN